jgi:hypothetical protein
LDGSYVQASLLTLVFLDISIHDQIELALEKGFGRLSDLESVSGSSLEELKRQANPRMAKASRRVSMEFGVCDKAFYYYSA